MIMKQPSFTLRNSLVILKKYKREGFANHLETDSNQQDEQGSPNNQSQYSNNNNFRLNIGNDAAEAAPA